MARKSYRYSLNRRDGKLVGVCSTIAERFGINPWLVRLGFVALIWPIGFELGALMLYAGLGIYFSMQRKRAVDAGQLSDFERMDYAARLRPSVHAMRTQLDTTDRRLMAIDDHINSTNEELAREIEALREEK